MTDLKINTNNIGGTIFQENEGHNAFNQLAVKVDANSISDSDYFAWLDKTIQTFKKDFPDFTFLEQEGVRFSPPLNTAVYYDTRQYSLLPTGSLLRTSCNKLTHAFCAFKMPEDQYGNRMDRRYVFKGHEKKTIQDNPYSDESVSVVKNLLGRSDIDHPGVFLEKSYGIRSPELSPSMVLFGHRSTFFVRIDGHDALRCSLDRSSVFDIRNDPHNRKTKKFREVEISIYPRIPKEISQDPRVVWLITFLTDSLISQFQTQVLHDIKYQRGSQLLGIDRDK